MRLLILGGSADARGLAEQLVNTGHTILYSTRRPVPPISGCRMRHGGFSNAGQNGIDGLTEYARRTDAELLLDATHPYAAQISKHACLAAKKLGRPCWRYQRRGWSAAAWGWQEWQDWADLLQALAPFRRPFLSLGASALQHIEQRPEYQHWIIRSILPHPSCAGITHISARGPFRYVDELRLLKQHSIDVLVCKNSGGHWTRAKLEAARALGLPILAQTRPRLPRVDRVLQKPAALLAALADWGG